MKFGQDKVIKDEQEQVRLQQQSKELREVENADLMAKVSVLESEKKKEITQLQHEIKKLEEDIDGLKQKMKSKENNPFFVQFNHFFQEVSDYLQQYRALTQTATDVALSKKELFALQRKLADAEYAGSQRELAMKKQLDEYLANFESTVKSLKKHSTSASSKQSSTVRSSNFSQTSASSNSSNQSSRLARSKIPRSAR